MSSPCWPTAENWIKPQGSFKELQNALDVVCRQSEWYTLHDHKLRFFYLIGKPQFVTAGIRET
jgi:hypothetical protein